MTEVNGKGMNMDETFSPDDESDPLGCSLLEESSFDEQLLRNDTKGDEHVDPLGCSFMESSDVGNSELPMTSTPKKHQERSILFDTEEFSEVRATPYAKKSNSGGAKRMKEKVTSDKVIIRDLQIECKCGQDCMQKVTFDLAYDLRTVYWNKNKEERLHFITSKMKNSLKCGRFTFLYLDNGLKLCLSAFRQTLKISKNKVTNKKINGVDNVKCGSKGYSGSVVKVVAWLELYASMYGDRMPHTNEVLLPNKTRLRNIYQLYVNEAEEPVAESTFYSVWKNHFPQLKVKKTNSFAQCTKCASLQLTLARTTCPLERQAIYKEKDLHNQRPMLERKYYYAKRESSKRSPDKYLSLIIDGMDQSKTDLPHFTGRQAKIINPSVLMKTHITGVISHGHGLLNTFIDVLEYSHDPNLTMNVLAKTIANIANREGKLPPVLYLQADNCYRENKNKYVFGFCESLVRLEIFKEVHISFLYSGHTHEDIDASFSKISQLLRCNAAETLDELVALIPNATRLEGMLDYKKWMVDQLTNIKGTSEALHYLFKGTSKSVEVYYKGQQHTGWIKMEGVGSFLKAIPKGKPKALKPDYARVIDNRDRLQKQIREIPFLFSNARNMEWWSEFLANPSTANQYTYISTFPKQQEEQTEEIQVTINEELQRLLDKESAIPKVICEQKKKGKKRKR